MTNDDCSAAAQEFVAMLFLILVMILTTVLIMVKLWPEPEPEPEPEPDPDPEPERRVAFMAPTGATSCARRLSGSARAEGQRVRVEASC